MFHAAETDGKLPPFVIGSEFGGTFVTETGCKHIFPFIAVVQTAEVTDQFAFIGRRVFRSASVFQCLPCAHIIIGIVIGGKIEILHVKIT